MSAGQRAPAMSDEYAPRPQGMPPASAAADDEEAPPPGFEPTHAQPPSLRKAAPQRPAFRQNGASQAGI